MCVCVCVYVKENSHIYTLILLALSRDDVNRDLYDGQRYSAVVQNLYALSAQSRKIGFQGPAIGVEYATANKRNFSQEVLNKSKSAVPGWSKGSLKNETTNMDGYGVIKTTDSTHSGVQSVWEQGAKKTETNSMDGYGVIKTKNSAHSGAQSVWEQGSKTANTTGLDNYGVVRQPQSGGGN